jgi:hypothetical protein
MITSLLFLLAAWLHPERRAGSLSLGVVFGILGAAVRAQSRRGQENQTDRLP